jgi:hypothetical protein
VILLTFFPLIGSLAIFCVVEGILSFPIG